MTNKEFQGTEIAKVLGSIYGSMIILAAVMLFLSSLFSGLNIDIQVRVFTLFWLIAFMISLLGAELARNLHKSGFGMIGFLGFLVLNYFLVVFLMAVYADMLDPTVGSTAIGMTLVYVVVAAIGYIALVLWVLRDWLKSRGN